MEECKNLIPFIKDIIDLTEPTRIYIELDEITTSSSHINIRKRKSTNTKRSIIAFNPNKTRYVIPIFGYLNNTDKVNKTIHNISIICLENAIELLKDNDIDTNIPNKKHYIFGQTLKINDIRIKNPDSQISYISIGDLYFYEHSLRTTRAFIGNEIIKKASVSKRKYDAFNLPF